MLNPAPTRGFTLIEVMITVFIVAVGLLSAAALQALSKKTAFDAVQRSSANNLAQDIIERMRGNGGELGLYAPASGLEIAADEAPPDQDCELSQPCTTAELAAHDLHQWWRGLVGAAEQLVEGSGASASRSNAGGLRAPTGCIRREAGSCRVTVAIAWRGMSAIAQGDPDDPLDPSNDPCGVGNPDYDDPGEAAGNARFRRVLVVPANLGEGRSTCLP